MVKIHNSVNDLIKVGLSIIPIKMPEKAPTVQWKEFQTRLPREGELTYNGSIALVCGKVSGGVEVIDVDTKNDPTLFERLEKAIEDQCPDALEYVTAQTTVNGGLHLIYKCSTIAGNQKLAEKVNREVLIETRGEGGYVVIAPTPGYVLTRGTFDNIQTITPEQREQLHTVCRSLNEYYEPVRTSHKNDVASPGLTPWDDYDQRGDVGALLESHGWKFVRKQGDSELWRRPGKDIGHSASWNGETFYCFTSSTGLEPGKAYSPAALFTFFECYGNFADAARRLYDRGFGERHKNPSISEKMATVRTAGEPLRMTFRYKRKNTTPALLINGTTLINFGEIFVLVGLPGEGKSAISEGIVATYLGNPTFGFECRSADKAILFIDTEQPPDDVSHCYNNIAKRLRTPVLDEDGEIARLNHLSVSHIERVDDLKCIIQSQLETGAFNFLLLDGVIDLASSMNDDVDSTSLVKWLRMLAVRFNCAVVVTIHPNKASEIIAGHLGAFLYRWARAILFARTCKHDKSIKELSAEPDMAKLSHGSKVDLMPVYYAWDASWQMLMPCDYEPPQDRGQDDKINNALAIVLADGKRYRYGELTKVIAKLGHSERTAKRWIAAAIDSGLVDNASGIYKLSTGTVTGTGTG